ncbi:MAG: hypothetical protein PHO37_11985 [Kiritimatiellae bacterium]|nr:hypothetical protein [Kiritimatiellia bacterium]
MLCDDIGGRVGACWGSWVSTVIPGAPILAGLVLSDADGDVGAPGTGLNNPPWSSLPSSRFAATPDTERLDNKPYIAA